MLKDIIKAAFTVAALTSGAAFLTDAYVKGMFLKEFGKAALLIGLNAITAKGANNTSGKNLGIKQAGVNSIAPRNVVYGKTRVGGTIVQRSVSGNSNTKLHHVIALAGHEINDIKKIFIDGGKGLVELDLSSDFTTATENGETVYRVTSSTFQNDENPEAYTDGSLIKLTFEKGDQTTANGYAQAQIGSDWTADHKLQGIAYVYINCIADKEKFPSYPTFSFEVEGKKVYDPVTATTVYSTNPALIIRDYLMDATYGFGAISSEINDATTGAGFVKARSDCNDSVSITGGTESRYTLNGQFDSTEEPQQVLQHMLSACAGQLLYNNGKFSLFVGKERTASGTITDDKLLAPISITTKASGQDLANGVKATYVRPSDNYIAAEITPYQDSTYLTADTPSGEQSADYENYMDLSFPYTQSTFTAQRLARISLDYHRQDQTLTAIVPLEFMTHQVGDIINFTNDRLGYSGKDFEIVAMGFEFIGDNYLALRLNLKEYAGSVFNNITYVADPTLPSAPSAGDNTVGTPTGLTLSESSKNTTAKEIYVKASWTNDDDDKIVATEVAFKKSTDSEFSSNYTSYPRTTFTFRAESSTTYNFKVRHISSTGVAGDYTSVVNITTSADVGTFTDGTIAGITVATDKLYEGTGTFNNSNTGFYLDDQGQFSLKDKLSFDGTTLNISGNLTVENTITADKIVVDGINLDNLISATDLASNNYLTTFTGAVNISSGGSGSGYPAELQIQATNFTNAIGTLQQAQSQLNIRARNNTSNGGIAFQGFNGTVVSTYGSFDSSGDMTFNNDVTVTGDLTVNGTTTTLNTATLDVEDKNITLNYSTGDSSASANGAGITIQDAVNSTTDATILWDATNDEFDFSHGITLPDAKLLKFGASSDLEISHGGTDSYITNNTGDLYITNKADDKDIIFRSDNGSGGFQTYFFLDGSAEQVVFEKSARFTDNDKAIFGTGSDLEIYHDGGNSFIRETGTGNFYIEGAGSVRIRGATTQENMIQASENGAVTLYYNNSAKIATTSSGIDVTGNIESTGTINVDTADSTLPNTYFSAERYNDSNGKLIFGVGEASPSGGTIGETFIGNHNRRLHLGSVFDGVNHAPNISIMHMMIDEDGDLYVSQNNTHTQWFQASTRNLHNIGTISNSGNITSTGSAHTFYSGGGTGEIAVGRSVNQEIEIFVDDTNNKIIARQDSDSNGTHRFILDRYFAGTGANDFHIRKGGTNQLTIDTNANATFAGTISSGKITANTGAAAAQPLTIGSSASSNYTLQNWITTAHSGVTAYMIAYGSGNSSQAGNFAMKNIASGGEIFFELQGGVEPLRLTSTGATFAGTISSGTITSSGNIDVNSDSGQLQFGADNDMQIFHNGAIGEINIATGDFLVDSVGDITLDAAGNDWNFNSQGGNKLKITNASGDVVLAVGQQDKDLIFKGNDGGSTITALTLDMSAGGNATFAGTIDSGAITTTDILTVNTDDFNYGIKVAQATGTGYAPASILLEATQAGSRGQGIYHYNTVNDKTWFTGTFYNNSSNSWGVAYASQTSFNSNIAQLANAKLIVTTGGSVGVGTTAPDALFHVKHANNNVVGKFESGDNQVWINLNDDGGGTYGALLGHDSDAGHMFAIADNSVTKRFVINDSGNVGIGTTSPAYKLDVVGKIKSSDRVLSNVYQSTSTYGMAWKNSGGSDNMFLSNAGSLGIGTTSPSEKLEVSGKILATGGQIRAGSYLESFPSFSFANDTDTGMFSDTANQLEFATGGTSRMTLDSSGRVGIGTATPSSATNVHLQKDNSAVLRVDAQDGGSAPAMTARIQLHGYEGRGAGIKIKDSVNSASGASSREWFVGSGYAQSGFNIGYAADGVQSSYAAQNKLTIQTDGDVGIGTSSPAQKLEVAGRVRATTDPTFEVYESSSERAGIQWVSSSNLYNIFSVGGDIRFERSSSEIGRFTSSGLSVNGAAAISGNYNTSLGGYQINGTTVIDNSRNLQNLESINMADNKRIFFGDSGDFGIKHDGFHTYIQNATGHVYFQQLADDNDIVFQSDNGSGGITEYLRLDGSGADGTSLYTRFPDNSNLTFGSSNDLRLFHNGTDSYIQNHTGSLNIENYSDDKDIYFKSDDGSGGLTTYFFLDGSDSSTRFTVNPLKFNDNIKALFGTGSDLQIYHDGSNSYIKDAGTGTLRILSDDVRIMNAAGTEISAQFIQDGEARLKYDNVTKLATKSTGIDVTGTTVTDILKADGGTYAAGVDTQTDAALVIPQTKKIYSLNSSGNYLRNIFYHDGSNGHYIFGQTGTSLIADMLFYAGSSGNFRFYASGSEDVRIDTSGNVNLKTGALQINGTTVIDSSRNLTNIGTISSGAITSSGTEFILGSGSISTKIKTINASGFTETAFEVYSSGAYRERIRIGNGGSVGIGTASPSSSQKLDVAGKIRASQDITITNGDLIVNTESKGIRMLSANGTEYLVFVNDSGQLVVEEQ
jgi:hypothetical protein